MDAPSGSATKTPHTGARVLVVGTGGREHAIAWKLAQSPRVAAVYSSPGSPGLAGIGPCVPGSLSDIPSLASRAEEEGIWLTVVGPEAWLERGIVDEFESRGLRVFGPTAAAASIECSKAFSKGLMRKYGIPTAAYETFTSLPEAMAYVRAHGAPIVVKADGLAAGKGAVVCGTVEEALTALRAMMADAAFGQAGSTVVVEDFMDGFEMTLLCFSDGETVVPMVPSQDHKRAYDHDMGPNTGGMGTYSPVPMVSEQLVEEAMQTIVRPAVRAMRAEGRPYKGVLYAGLMLTATGPKVVEFNARFGDPETQVVLPRLKTDLLDVLDACVDGRLGDLPLQWSPEHTACVVMASGGYPDSYRVGYPVSGIAQADAIGALVFHAGTGRSADGDLVTAGGRVLNVVGRGPTTQLALQQAYAAVSCIGFEGAEYRHDIGWQVVGR